MTRNALGPLPLDRESGTPLSRQICDALRNRIADGRLAAGDALPASRALAEDLGVSRSTVVTAYDQLAAEGYAAGRRGSGVYVGDIGAVEAAPSGPRAARPPARPPAPPGNPEPFRPGLPDMRLFPYRQWGRTVARTARADTAAMIRETEPFGDPVLRGEIVRHLADWRGIEARPDQVVVTAGAGDALEITIRALAGAGETVALEDPGYQPLRSFVASMGLKPLWMPVDADGATVPGTGGAARSPRLTVLTPSHQFPLGGAMPTSRRHAFLNFAEETGGWIVEDDFDSEFRYAGRPIPALASLDRGGRVIYVGSFSKVFSLGLRLGYLVVPESLQPAFAETLQRFRPKASAALQRPLAAFMADGEFHRHIRRMRRIYAERYRQFLEMLTLRFGENVRWQTHQAGMQIALHLAADADDRELASRARAAGVVCPALSDFHAGEVRHRGLLMGFCAYDEAEMRRAFDRLAAALLELAVR